MGTGVHKDATHVRLDSEADTAAANKKKHDPMS